MGRCMADIHSGLRSICRELLGRFRVVSFQRNGLERGFGGWVGVGAAGQGRSG